MIIKAIGQLTQGRTLVSVDPDSTVNAACMLMATRNIGALAVVEQGHLVGILSERDVIRRCIAECRKTRETLVRDVMTTNPVTISVDTSLTEAQTLMAEGKFRHLPLVDDTGRAIAMVSMRDIPTEYRQMVERFREFRNDSASI